MTQPPPVPPGPLGSLTDLAADAAFAEVSPGIERHAMHAGAFSVLRIRLRAGARLPQHEHPHEQYIHLLSGRVQVTVQLPDRRAGFMLSPGDGVRLPPWLPHETEALLDSQTIEVFAPARDDLAAQ